MAREQAIEGSGARWWLLIVRGMELILAVTPVGLWLAIDHDDCDTSGVLLTHGFMAGFALVVVAIAAAVVAGQMRDGSPTELDIGSNSTLRELLWVGAALLVSLVATIVLLSSAWDGCFVD